MTAPDHFTTPRLSARRVNGTDLQYVVTVDSDPVMAKWLGGSVSTRAESEARLHRWLQEERESGLGFWIFFRDEQPVGHGGLFLSKRDPGFIELGYAILPEHWGNGYATEMARAFLDIARNLELQNVVALTRVTNVRSRHVLEKCGLRLDRELHIEQTHFARYVLPT